MEKQVIMSRAKAVGNIVFLLFGLLLLCPAEAGAQQLRFATFSYQKAFVSMPQYVIMQRNLANLEAQYSAETKRAEEEFNKKFEVFLLEQRTLAEPIRVKRQAELQELMEKNIAFRDEARRLLEAARQDAETPLRKRIDEAVAVIGAEGGYAFVLNTDGNACPYVNPAMAEDVTERLIVLLAKPAQ